MKRIILLNLMLLVLLPVFSFDEPDDLNGNNKLKSVHNQVGFTENKGQFRDQQGNPNPDVLYIADFGGMKVQLRKTGFSYETYQVKPKWVDPATIPYKILTFTENGDTLESWPGQTEAQKNLMYHFHRVDVELVGAKLNPEILNEGKTGETKRYLMLAQGGESVEVDKFLQVRYNDVYPGIDLLCYANSAEGGFKYDFILKPGANLSVIELEYKGAEMLDLEKDGNLNLKTRFGVLSEFIPACYTEDASGNRKEVSGIGYQLVGNKLKFRGKAIQFDEKLVIDPAVNLVWGTYYGDSGCESFSATAVDLEGFIYSCGNTSSAMNIATFGTFLDSLLLPADGFLVKISPQGQRTWGTYLNGFAARDIAIGNNSDIVINGENGILKFDTTGNLSWVLQENHFQTAVAITRQGEIIAIGDSVVKLSPSGINLWKNSFGGPQTFLKDVTTDTAGNIIITGLTKDYNGVSTQGSYQPVYGGGSNKWGGYHLFYFTDSYGDAFLAKLSPDGSVIWSTYYGGNDYDEGTSVSVNDNGKIVMAGRTNSLTGISTSGSFQPNLSSNGPIAFVILNINFNWPCPDPDNMWAFIDTCLYGPYIPKLFDLRYQDHDCFFTWFDGDGNRISSTYYGDLYRDFSPKVACSQDKVYFGSTGFRRYNTSNKLASDFPFLDHTGPGINNDYIFLACFDTVCHREWGTYYGDIQDISSLTPVHDGNLFISEICISPGNSYIISGGCQNFEGIATPGTYKPFKSIDPNHPYHQLLGWDAFISKLSSTDAIMQPIPNQTTCTDDSIAFSYFDPLFMDSTLNHQWFKDSIPVPTGNNAILQLNPVGSADQGYYHCIISSGDFFYFLPRFYVTVADTIEFNLQQSGMSNSNPLLGDFNGDGYLDIIGTSIFVNQNNAYLPAGYYFVQQPDQLSDIDGNGTIDILAGNRVFLNKTDSLQSVEVPATVTSWLDIDNDGDQDGIFYGYDPFSWKVYALINEDLSFTLKMYNIINDPWGPISCNNGSIAADFNNDGETDLVVYGSGSSGCSSSSYCYYLERQADQFLFHNISIPEFTLHFTVGAADWNSDGFTDLLFSGYDNSTIENCLLKILEYDSGVFLVVYTDTFPGSTFNWSECPGKWIDLDNDGDPDIIHGKDLIINNNCTFQEIQSTGNPLINTGLTNVAWDTGDSDNDGYPEIISEYDIFREISCSSPNTPPTPPFSLISAVSNDTVFFSWQRANDLETPQMGLTYNLRVGTTPGGNDIMSSLSDSTGWRKVVGMGNVYQNTSWWLHSLSPGTYYWSVQAIDNSYAGGPFAPEQTFVIPEPMEQTIAIPQGWSGISAYLQPGTTAIEQVFQPVQNNLVILQTLQEIYYPAQNINTIGNWESQSAYKIKACSDVSLFLSGLADNKTLDLDAGWNLMPVICNVPVEPATLLGPEQNELKIIKEIAGNGVYWPEYGINTLGALLPGKAYFTRMENPVTIIFPPNDYNGLKSKICTERTLEEPSPWGMVQKTPSSHLIAIPIAALAEVESGSYLGVFTPEGICAGYCLIYSEKTAVLVAGMDDPFTASKEGFAEGEPFSFRLWIPEKEQEQRVQVNFDRTQPQAEGIFMPEGISAIQSLEGFTAVEESTLTRLHIFPNPARDMLNITGITRTVTLTLQTYTGKILQQKVLLTDGRMDLSSLPAGIYVLKMEDGKAVRFEKVVVE